MKRIIFCNLIKKGDTNLWAWVLCLVFVLLARRWPGVLVKKWKHLRLNFVQWWYVLQGDWRLLWREVWWYSICPYGHVLVGLVANIEIIYLQNWSCNVIIEYGKMIWPKFLKWSFCYKCLQLLYCQLLNLFTNTTFAVTEKNLWFNTALRRAVGMSTLMTNQFLLETS